MKIGRIKNIPTTKPDYVIRPPFFNRPRRTIQNNYYIQVDDDDKNNEEDCGCGCRGNCKGKKRGRIVLKAILIFLAIVGVVSLLGGKLIK